MASRKVRSAIDNQVQNRNFLQPTGFKFGLERSPKVAFFCNSANIPGMTLGIANQPTYLRDIPTPGDKIDFEDLNLRFLVDEDFENYMELYTWIRGLGFPESLQEIYDLQKEKRDRVHDHTRGLNIYSDGTLLILNSSQNLEFKVVFRDLFPYSLSTIQFDATDSTLEYFTADVSFKYTIFDVVTPFDKKLHPREISTDMLGSTSN
jgi:hypothetical protein